MDFELESWPLLPHAVIAQDETTRNQERLESDRRSRGNLSTAAMEARRQQLADRFGCEVPSQAFFREVCADDSCTGPAVVLARCAKYRQEVKDQLRQLEAKGCEFVFWPKDGRWPHASVDPQISARRSALTTRLAKRHRSLSDLALAQQRRATEVLAQFILKQCYRQAPLQQDQSTELPRLLLRHCYKRQVSAKCVKDMKQTEVQCLHPATINFEDMAMWSASKTMPLVSLGDIERETEDSGMCEDGTKLARCNFSY